MVTLGRKKKEEFVRIKIGNSETGNKGFHAPIKTINIPNHSVEEVYELIIKMLEKKLKDIPNC